MSPEAMKSKAAAPASAMKAIMKETMQASKKTEVKAKISKAAAPAPAMTAAMKAMKSAKDKSSKGKSNKSCSKGCGPRGGLSRIIVVVQSASVPVRFICHSLLLLSLSSDCPCRLHHACMTQQHE